MEGMTMGAFGRAFATRKEANAFLKKHDPHGWKGESVRKMSKKLFPRRKKLFHVGTDLDFINFA
jgi:hypothetical protein